MNNKIPNWDIFIDRSFTTPLPSDSFLRNIDKNSPILDFGCGHGRLISFLMERGFINVTGVDTAYGLLKNAKENNPQAFIYNLDEWKWPKYTYSFVFSLGVFGCINPESIIIESIENIYDGMKAGGILYLEDFLINDSAPYIERYESGIKSFKKYGIWEHESGLIIRHFDESDLLTLLKRFEILEKENLNFKTLDGYGSKGIRIILKKPYCNI